MKEEKIIDFSSGLRSMFKMLSLSNIGVGKKILLTGEFPYRKDDLFEVLDFFQYVCVDETSNNDPLDYLIIGRKDFDNKIILKCVKKYGNDVRYLPQEAFFDLLCFGNDWYESPYLLEELADSHPGLQFLIGCGGFRWPSTDAEESNGLGTYEAEYADETELHRLGYIVGKKGRDHGMGDADRWKLLANKAVPMLGLKDVVETIASNTRRFKMQNNGKIKFKLAIRDYEHDLERLKKEYYKRQFNWPSTEP